MKTDISPSCGHCWVFQICWHIECSTFIALSFRIWNSSAGIPSPPLALFIIMLPKVLLTSHSRISGSRWMITSSWLSGSWRSFLYSSAYFCHLFLISSTYVRSIPFLSFIVPIFPWMFIFILSSKNNFVFSIFLSSAKWKWSLYILINNNYPSQVHSTDNIFLWASFYATLYLDISFSPTDSSVKWV